MKWKPLQKAMSPLQVGEPHTERVIAMQMEQKRCTREQAIEKLEAYEASCEYWLNDLYQVQTRRFTNAVWNAEMMHLNIRRRDGAAVFDWRHRQLIKNQLLGAECEAFELYPAESRLVDTSNKYHLWGFVNPEVRLPVEIGTGERDVIEHEIIAPAGERQRRIIK